MSRFPERIDSKYRYVLLASKRAEQLVEGAMPKETGEKDKPTRVAMAEIAADKVAWDYGPAEEPEEEVAEELVEATEAES